MLCENYGVEVDLWAAGCVFSEMLRGGRVMFEGKSNADQLAKIMMLLGSPSEQQTAKLNPRYNFAKLPYADASSIYNCFPSSTPKEAIDLVLALLDYDPGRRITAVQALGHPFFDQLRDPKTKLPDGSSIPDFIFDFTEEELSLMKTVAGGHDLIRKVVPHHKLQPAEQQRSLSAMAATGV